MQTRRATMIRSLLRRPVLKAWRPLQARTNRQYSKANALFVNPSEPNDQLISISIGGPTDSFVDLEPEIASKLAQKALTNLKYAEVPMTYFHKSRHLALGKAFGAYRTQTH